MGGGQRQDPKANKERNQCVVMSTFLCFLNKEEQPDIEKRMGNKIS